jgi:lipopolysaccharide biosynthesis protein
MNNVKPIAIYLPQFHTIPENDKWWGEGFTEWVNVKKGELLFEGHYQPHIPHESIGYYNLSNPEILINQAAMAQNYGIYGFCFYHYWFGGKKLLDLPVENYLKSADRTSFPFCLCWANENWTRRWDGRENEILIAQNHSDEDDLAFILDKIPYFKDSRYVRINDKPVLLIYRTELLPDPKKSAAIWRQAMREHGIGEIYLIRIESIDANINPMDIGFDAATEFAPDWRNLGNEVTPEPINRETPLVIDYYDTIMRILSKKMPDYKIFRCVFPHWDNSARRGSSALAFINTDIDIFEFYLQKVIDFTRKHHKEEEQFFFINAWNEWGEGCHLEPDKKNQFKYLESCKKVLDKRVTNPIYDLLLNMYSRERETAQNLKELTQKTERILNSKPYKLLKLILKPVKFIWDKIK